MSNQNPQSGMKTLYNRELRANEFRLIKLHQGNWEIPLRCDLLTGNLETSPQYQALSYAWGSLNATRSIMVNGVRVEITVNLETALRLLRREDAYVFFWADALCINQKNPSERRAQVQIMRKIYVRASSTTVFLGDGNLQSPSRSLRPTKLRKLIFFGDTRDSQHINQLICNCKSKSITRLSADFAVFSLIAMFAQQDRQQIHVLSTIENDTLQAIFEDLRMMLLSKWWSRMWVFQEIIVSLNPVVQYGQCITAWSVFTRAARNIEDGVYPDFLSSDCVKVLEFFSTTISDIEDHRSRWASLETPERNDAGVELLDLLQVTSTRKASDDRDKIYALLGLLPAGLDILPNYSMETSWVWAQVARNVVKATGSLDVLAGFLGQKNSRSDLPSWVPDWSALTYGQEVQRSKIATRLYNACKGSKATCWTSPKSFWLSVCKDILSRALPEAQSSLSHDFSIELFSLGLVNFTPFNPREPPEASRRNVFSPNWSGWWVDFGQYHPYAPQLTRLWISGTYAGTIEAVGSQFPSVADGEIPPFSHTQWRKMFAPIASTNSFRERQAFPSWASRWESQISPVRPDGIEDKVLKTIVFDLKYVSGQFQRLGIGDMMHLRSWWEAKVSPTSPSHEDILGFDHVLSFMASRRRLFMTNFGHFGWGPSYLVPGDHIFILPGGMTPYILRSDSNIPYETTVLTAQMVGNCYLQNAMDGQLVSSLPSYCQEDRVLSQDYVYQLRRMLSRLPYNSVLTDLSAEDKNSFFATFHETYKASNSQPITGNKLNAMLRWLEDRRQLRLQCKPLQTIYTLIQFIQWVDTPNQNQFTLPRELWNPDLRQSYLICLE